MIKIGQYNELRISRFVDFGAYVTDETTEVLLPIRYLKESDVVGDVVRVFVYTDSEDRLVATTEIPFATVGEFAFLQVKQVNKIGAFMDWGLQKDLLVPYSEQKNKMQPGGTYLVYLYLDNNTKRVVASAKIERHLGNVFADYTPGDKVKVLVIAHTEIGYKVIVDNLHLGMVYDNEIFQPVEIGETLDAYVKHVREDGKIDLRLKASNTVKRISPLTDTILEMLAMGEFKLTDKSSPEDIKATLHCSKKDFKKAIGALYKEHKIAISPTSEITLA
jgi:hypothetical protein